MNPNEGLKSKYMLGINSTGYDFVNIGIFVISSEIILKECVNNTFLVFYNQAS